MPDYVPMRTTAGKEATAGELGTIAQCIGGDLVCAQSCDGTRYAWLLVGWTFDDGEAMCHVHSAKRGCIDLRAPFLRQIKGWQKCRYLALRNR